MTKLERSVRKHLHFYLSDLKAMRYWPAGKGGLLPEGFRGYISTAVADMEEGVCTGLTIYTVGEAEQRKHYYMQEGVVSITEAVCNFLEDSGADYDSLVAAICETIKGHTVQETQPIYTGRMIPLTQYAEMHGRESSTVRRRAIRGGFQTAVKLGRDWLIREDEPYTDLRLASERIKRNDP